MNPSRPSKDKEPPGAGASSQVTFVSTNLSLSSNGSSRSRLESSRSIRKNYAVVVFEPKWYVCATDCFSDCDDDASVK